MPTPRRDSPAKRALEMEGLAVHESYCSHEHDYGSMFAALWDLGEPFVVVEWDIVPWPGAVSNLLACGKPWCTHRYPLGRGNLTTSFGIGKYDPAGSAPEHWATTEWQQLDGQVLPLVRERLGAAHIHCPPVAHARRPSA